MTMMVIRIAMMMTAFMRRHLNRLERLRLGEGVPTHTHKCVHTYLAGYRYITDLSSNSIACWETWERVYEGE